MFQEIFYRPLFNATVFLYNLIPGADLGIAIIALTILIRVIFLPLSLKAVRSQKALSALNPKMQEIKEKYKNNQQAQTQAIIQLYKDHKVNPLSGCLPLLIQLPILFALYQVFRNGFNATNIELLYPFIQTPESFNTMFLGILDITQKSVLLAFIVGILQFIQSYITAQNTTTPKEGMAKEMASLNKQMLYIFPVIMVVISWSLPAGVVLYLFATTLFSVFEQKYVQVRN